MDVREGGSHKLTCKHLASPGCTRADFHPKLIGLTGTHSQIKRVAKLFRLYFSAPPKAVDDDESDYLVDHSIFFYLVNPAGEYEQHFGREMEAEGMAAQIATLVRAFDK